MIPTKLLSDQLCHLHMHSGVGPGKLLGSQSTTWPLGQSEREGDVPPPVQDAKRKIYTDHLVVDYKVCLQFCIRADVFMMQAIIFGSTGPVSTPMMQLYTSCFKVWMTWIHTVCMYTII